MSLLWVVVAVFSVFVLSCKLILECQKKEFWEEHTIREEARKMERACIFKLYENQILNKNICIYMIYIYIFIFIYFQTTIIRGYKYYVPRNSDKYSVTVNVYIFILYISSECIKPVSCSFHRRVQQGWMCYALLPFSYSSPPPKPALLAFLALWSRSILSCVHI